MRGVGESRRRGSSAGVSPSGIGSRTCLDAYAAYVFADALNLCELGELGYARVAVEPVVMDSLCRARADTYSALFAEGAERFGRGVGVHGCVGENRCVPNLCTELRVDEQARDTAGSYPGELSDGPVRDMAELAGPVDDLRGGNWSRPVTESLYTVCDPQRRLVEHPVDSFVCVSVEDSRLVVYVVQHIFRQPNAHRYRSRHSVEQPVDRRMVRDVRSGEFGDAKEIDPLAAGVFFEIGSQLVAIVLCRW